MCSLFWISKNYHEMTGLTTSNIDGSGAVPSFLYFSDASSFTPIRKGYTEPIWTQVVEVASLRPANRTIQNEKPRPSRRDFRGKSDELDIIFIVQPFWTNWNQWLRPSWWLLAFTSWLALTQKSTKPSVPASSLYQVFSSVGRVWSILFLYSTVLINVCLGSWLPLCQKGLNNASIPNNQAECLVKVTLKRSEESRRRRPMVVPKLTVNCIPDSSEVWTRTRTWWKRANVEKGQLQDTHEMTSMNWPATFKHWQPAVIARQSSCDLRQGAS